MSTFDSAIQHAFSLVKAGDLSSASAVSRQLATQLPKRVESYCAWWLCLLLQNDLAGLRRALDECWATQGEPYFLHLRDALTLLVKGDHEGAIQAAVAANKLDDKLPFPLLIVAFAQLQCDRFTEAFHNFTSAFALLNVPEPLKILRLRCLEQIEATKYSERLKRGALEYLQRSDLNHTRISRLVSTLIASQLGLDAGATDIGIEQVLSNRLLQQTLGTLILRNRQLELFLIQMRQHLLLQVYQSLPVSDDLARFAAKLALQCFFNEYVYEEADDETLLVTHLQARAEKSLASGDATSRPLHLQLLVLALYRPLDSIASVGPVVQQQDELLSELIRVTVMNTRAERLLAQSLPCVGGIDNEISQRVQAQYEANPYPRWISFDRLVLRQNYFAAMSHEYVASVVHRPTAANPTRVLIAGCGTGQHAISVANRYEHVDVVAIDISLASLAYAKRMAQHYDIRNIEFIHCDILRVTELERQFDVIESVGTLHHMESPDAGLTALAGVLAPHGVMRIGLYSELARRRINEIRRTVMRDMITHFDAKTFRRLRHQLMLRAPDHPLQDNPLLDCTDFYSSSGCRDLLCHVQEHQYTIAKLQLLLTNAHLQFGAFNFQSGRSLGPLLYRQRYGHHTALNILQNWQAVEEDMPDLFADMYIFYAQALRAA